MSQKELTHKDLAGMLGVSVTTIKSYRRKFPGALPVVSRGKPIRFKPEAAEVCRLIRQGFLANRTVEDIRQTLAREFSFIRSRASGRKAVGQDQDAPRLLQEIMEKLDHMLERQRHLSERMDDLGGQVACLLEKHGRQAEKEEPQESVRRIRVRDSKGQDTVYTFETEEKEGGAGSEGKEVQEEKESKLLDQLRGLPLVIHTERNEFLGVAGKSAGPFSLENFLDLMNATSPDGFKLEYSSLGKELSVKLTRESGQHMEYGLHMNPMLTPMGNEVSVLLALTINGEDMPPPNLFAVIKTLRDGLSS